VRVTVAVDEGVAVAVGVEDATKVGVRVRVAVAKPVAVGEGVAPVMTTMPPVTAAGIGSARSFDNITSRSRSVLPG
jgi:hypothetical protein